MFSASIVTSLNFFLLKEQLCTIPRAHPGATCTEEIWIWAVALQTKRPQQYKRTTLQKPKSKIQRPWSWSNPISMKEPKAVRLSNIMQDQRTVPWWTCISAMLKTATAGKIPAYAAQHLLYLYGSQNSAHSLSATPVQARTIENCKHDFLPCNADTMIL